MVINKERLLEQLKKDEGFVSKAYWDNKQYSIGYGTKALNKDEVISREEAEKRLDVHLQKAVAWFYVIFDGHLEKFNDVRAEAFINMIYNMGPGSKSNPKGGGLYSFVNTLGHIFDYDVVDWKRVAYNLRQSKWFKQVGKRAVRICNEIETGVKGK